MTRTAWAGRVTVAAVLLGGAAVLAAGELVPGDNRWGAGYFPNVELVTQDGQTVRLYEDLLKGKSVAINAMFTECSDVCPLETAALVQLKRSLGQRVGREIFFYSISIDPKHDTPAVLKAYAERFGAGGPGWLFLTGKPEDVKLVIKKLGLARRQDAASRDGHGSILMVGNEPTGQWMKNSALDTPAFLAARLAVFFGWKDVQPVRSYADVRPLPSDAGRYLFESRCGSCHSIGQGDKIGPDLANVSARRERAWLARYIEVPDQVLAEGDPVATALFRKYKGVRMPNLRLDAEEVAVVLAHIGDQTKLQQAKSGQHTGHAH